MYSACDLESLSDHVPAKRHMILDYKHRKFLFFFVCGLPNRILLYIFRTSVTVCNTNIQMQSRKYVVLHRQITMKMSKPNSCHILVVNMNQGSENAEFWRQNTAHNSHMEQFLSASHFTLPIRRKSCFKLFSLFEVLHVHSVRFDSRAAAEPLS